MPKASPKKTPEEKRPDYFEITLPKVRLKDTPLAPLWVFLLMLLSFLLGMLTTKLQYMGTTQTSQNTQQAQITNDDIKKWAREIRVDRKQFNDCFDQNKYDNLISLDASDAIAASAEATPTFYINGTRVVGAQPYAAFKIIIDEAIQKKVVGPFTVSKGHLPALGNSKAPVTMIEFSDLQCPFCRQFFTTAFPQIKKDYIDTGKVALYYRHLPLTIHPMAKPFANATECAHEQNKFWEMHDLIFEKQG